MKVTKGQQYILTAGEYSDYNIHRTIEIVQDFDWNEKVREYKTLPDVNQHWALYEFSDWLVKSGLIKDIELPEIHLGDYELEEK